MDVWYVRTARRGETCFVFLYREFIHSLVLAIHVCSLSFVASTLNIHQLEAIDFLFLRLLFISLQFHIGFLTD